MKIGIMTFHWATNYGAVLQAYALQSYIEGTGNMAEIINYYPSKYKKNLINSIATKHICLIPNRIREISKDRKIEGFRKKYLKRTKYYDTTEKLKNAELDYDCFICGSDQVWNESFLEFGEGALKKRKNPSYLLNFVPDDRIIASYAASFGELKYKESLKGYLKKYLARFDFLSVRENSALDILNDIGIKKGCVVPDPTLLHTKKIYEQLLLKNRHDEKYNFVYMLHGRLKDAEKMMNNTDNKNIICENTGVEGWLTDIYYSETVITNSFHGVVFSIIFQKPFAAVLIKGSGMNDRIITLLDRLGLADRIFNGDTDMINAPIDWDSVGVKLNTYREGGYAYINELLNYKKGILNSVNKYFIMY